VRNILLFIGHLIIVVLLFVGCSNDNANNRLDIISENLDQAIVGMIEGEEKSILLPVEYDSVVISPPYISKDDFKSSQDIDKQLTKEILKNITTEENYHLFIIKNNKIVYYTVLSKEFSTENNDILQINYPDKILIKKTSETLRSCKILADENVN
jgi:hypothetical protein